MVKKSLSLHIQSTNFYLIRPPYGVNCAYRPHLVSVDGKVHLTVCCVWLNKVAFSPNRSTSVSIVSWRNFILLTLTTSAVSFVLPRLYSNTILSSLNSRNVAHPDESTTEHSAIIHTNRSRRGVGIECPMSIWTRSALSHFGSLFHSPRKSWSTSKRMRW